MRSALGANAKAVGDLRLEVTAPDAFRRSFCWTGTTQSGVRKEGP